MHMRNGCLGLLRLGPDPVHKFPLHSEAACHPQRGATVALDGRHVNRVPRETPKWIAFSFSGVHNPPLHNENRLKQRIPRVLAYE